MAADTACLATVVVVDDDGAGGRSISWYIMWVVNGVVVVNNDKSTAMRILFGSVALERAT